MDTERLRGDGSSRPGRGAFLSPRAIDAQLRNIFAKLGVASRSQLRHFEFGGAGQGDLAGARVSPAEQGRAAT
ncbi:MAG TPA: hypothetical protein VLW50_05585 [Streptosporangiaceae bacterium]|nr:hypothetical protein [Streptosporangiaceae bacterium]